jgi:hypothetical protein
VGAFSESPSGWLGYPNVIKVWVLIANLADGCEPMLGKVSLKRRFLTRTHAYGPFAIRVLCDLQRGPEQKC